MQLNPHGLTAIFPLELTHSLSALPEFTFRRVLLKGKILYPPILLGPRVEEGVPGWDLIQPLSRTPPSSLTLSSSVADSPSTILLNRGFIPNPQAAAIRQGHEPPPNVGEEIVVEGYLSKLIGQGWSPENMPERGEWFWKDVERMADWCGGEERGVQPVLVDVIDRESCCVSPVGDQIPRGRKAVAVVPLVLRRQAIQLLGPYARPAEMAEG
jgi:surfeit locus 1 family protein